MVAADETKPDFYLASTEHEDFVEPRACWTVGRTSAFGRNDCLVVRVEPSVIGQPYGLGEKDFEYLILASRFAGSTLLPINEWPLHVYVSGLKAAPGKESYEEAEYEYLAWAELYPTLERASRHR